MNEFDLRNFLYNNPLLEATKKGNEEEEKREEGAIADDRDHIDALDADAEADEKKLAKLKKDKKKDVELAGEDADTAAILGLLTKAQSEAESLGDEKLMDQIGNTITYYTRAHVVKSTETRAVAETKLFTRRR